MTKTNIVKLDALSDKYIKKWQSMPPSGTLDVLHVREGLNIKSLHTSITNYMQSPMLPPNSRTVNVALSSHVASEEKWTSKGSATSYSEDHFSQVVQEILPDVSIFRWRQ